MGAEYTPVFLLLIVAFAIGAGMMIASSVLAPSKLTKVKQMPYESGMDPIGDARQRFDVRFYLVAIVFLLFDVELLFLYPWAVVYRQMLADHATRNLVFGSMISFLVILFAGYLYALKKKAFDWKS